MRHMLCGAAALAVAMGVSGAAQAATYALSWTGFGTYSMTGSFSFDDALLGGVITGGDLDDLEISVFQGATLIGTRSIAVDGLGSFAGDFNFNFDSGAEAFQVGGFSGGPNGQDWFTNVGGTLCDTVGFSSGNSAQGVCVSGLGFFGSIAIESSTLVAVRQDDPEPGVIPLPASLPLLLGGLGGLALLRRRARG